MTWNSKQMPNLITNMERLPLSLSLGSSHVLIAGSLSHVPDYSFRAVSRSPDLLKFELGTKLSSFIIPSQREIAQQFAVILIPDTRRVYGSSVLLRLYDKYHFQFE